MPQPLHYGKISFSFCEFQSINFCCYKLIMIVILANLSCCRHFLLYSSRALHIFWIEHYYSPWRSCAVFHFAPWTLNLWIQTNGTWHWKIMSEHFSFKYYRIKPFWAVMPCIAGFLVLIQECKAFIVHSSSKKVRFGYSAAVIWLKLFWTLTA